MKADDDSLPEPTEETKRATLAFINHKSFDPETMQGTVFGVLCGLFTFDENTGMVSLAEWGNTRTTH